MMPVLLDQPGVGPMSAAQLLVSWSHPGRCRSEAASPPSQGQSAGSILRQDHPAQACPGSGRPGSPGADRGPAGETRWRPDAAGWFFAGCPADVAACAASRLRGQHWKITSEVTPLPAWPAVPRSYVLGTRDPVINPAWSRRAASAVLEVRAVEIDAGHSPFLAIPAVLARILDTLAADPGPRLSGALPSSRWVPWPCPRWFPSRDQLLILA